MSRVRLMNRRPAVVERIEWQGRAYELGLGFDGDGHVRELFLDGHKSGTDLEALLDDWAVTASLALQHGATVSGLAGSMGWALVPAGDGERAPISLIGHLFAVAAAIEKAEGANAAALYAQVPA